ncbi:MAG TPA: succinate dehydrogenase, hydrophobic membrane anchor protein [Stellaceae bacterium]|jgi:succinate dehydrogenase / fumarate reductase membrane anchor subunit|nr:succinate dehydrogenase, hydrophobic membrane anchor protein [Stellaceae bacterium]
MSDTRLRSPLGRVMGLGSAKEGVAHWWAQRLTAVALIPLVLWFVIALIGLTGASRAAVVAWLHAPLPAIATVLMLIAMFYHMALGVQVVIEDYVHREGTKIALLVLNKFFVYALAAAGIFAVLRIAFMS